MENSLGSTSSSSNGGIQAANNQRNSSGISPISCRDLFDGTGRYFSAAEIEFMAENCLVSIKPRRKMEEIDLISVKRRRFSVFQFSYVFVRVLG